MGDENEMEIVDIVGEIFSIREANVAMSIAMAIFLIILIVGFIYEWKKGALEWD